MSNKLGQNHRLAWDGLFSVFDVVTKEVDRRMREAGGVPLDVFEQLAILAATPDRRLKMSTLAGQVSRSMSGATRIAERLEKDGYIEREASKEDRRVVYAYLTDKGLAAHERSLPIYEDGIQELFASHMTVAEAVAMTAIFRKICA